MQNGPANNDNDQGPGNLPDNARMEIERTAEQALFARIKAEPSYIAKQKLINSLTTEQKINLQNFMRKNVEDAPPRASQVNLRRHPSV